MSTPLVVAERTGRHRRDLRRYQMSGDRPCPVSGYHTAVTDIGEITEVEHREASGDDWPHDDPRWPAVCGCGYEFTPADQWQRNDNRVYRMPDGREFAFRGSFGRAAPVGAMIRAWWYDGFSSHPDGVESWLIALPDGGEWITSQRASGGGYWTVTGTVPNITVSPSIFHNAPHGWHGWIRDGQLVDA